MALPQPTDRIVFRWWRPDDLPLALALWGDARVTALIGGPFGPEQVQARLARELQLGRDLQLQYWPIHSRDQVHLGCCGLRPHDLARGVLELGVHLLPEHSGRGLASEASRAVLDCAFDACGARAVFAGHHPRNAASRRLLTKLGFRHTHEELYPPTGLMHPSYVISAAEWTGAR